MPQQKQKTSDSDGVHRVAILVANMVEAIVVHKDQVVVEVTRAPVNGQMVNVVKFSTAESDSGLVFGAKRSVLSAICRVFSAACKTHGVDVVLRYTNDWEYTNRRRD